jgi:murein DD-endopeptidase MepM/ murein hydrolase activator NlpD
MATAPLSDSNPAMMKPHVEHKETRPFMASPMYPRRSILIGLASFLVKPTLSDAQQPSLNWSPEKVEVGSPIFFTLATPRADRVTATWQRHELEFFQSPSDPNHWYALAGIDVGSDPGPNEITVVVDRNGESQTLHRTIQVASAPYKEIPLTVPEKFVQPDAKALERIAAEQKLKTRVFADSAQSPLWNGRFLPPLKSAPSTDSFGTRRIFNGSLASVHRGLDYRAKTGTPVMATNSGRVILARPLYYEGNCVVIDHGLGLVTLSMHLYHFNVKEGERVHRGQIIARSGATGRATGPHLHLTARWQGESFDPAKLFLLKLPATVPERAQRHS